ncbi:MAG TPA: nucleotidyltransferase family protein [Gammaproteobacteria bacterium]|nr:nucleotidyltransferase family protein [Gammaproteobacteria bacterium]
MKAMILAAGRGERLRPLTDTTPKPLLEVKGKPLVVHHLERLRDAGYTQIHINTSWLADKIQGALGDGGQYGVHIHYSYEGPEPLETGGGIFRLLPKLGREPFLVVNGDVFTDFPFETLKHRLKHDDLAHLVMVPNPLHHPEGDFHLTTTGHLHPQGEPKLTYSGIGVYKADFFKECRAGKFKLLPLMESAMAMEALSGEFYGGLWSDVGNPENIEVLKVTK